MDTDTDIIRNYDKTKFGESDSEPGDKNLQRMNTKEAIYLKFNGAHRCWRENSYCGRDDTEPCP